jgi:hypothetical protein
VASDRDPYQWGFHVAIGLLVLFAVLGYASYVIPAAYLSVAGVTFPGQVVAKHESIVLGPAGTSEHHFDVTYRYRPTALKAAATGSHDVGPVASSIPLVGASSALDDVAWTSRIPRGSDDARNVADWLACGAAVVVGLAAYRTRRRWLVVIAGTCAATVLSTILWFGAFVFPVLFLGWRRKPETGVGWVLLLSVPLTATFLYWRIPWPVEMPPGPQRVVMATVQSTRESTSIWNIGPRTGGRNVPQPFEMVDLEFTPEGATEAVHALDGVDVGTVAGLERGSMVRVTYPVSDPRAGRMIGGTRTYARRALVHVLTVAYVPAGIVVLVLLPVMGFVGKRVRASPVFGALAATGDAVRQISSLSADDPRRQALEETLRRGHDR